MGGSVGAPYASSSSYGYDVHTAPPSPPPSHRSVAALPLPLLAPQALSHASDSAAVYGAQVEGGGKEQAGETPKDGGWDGMGRIEEEERRRKGT